MRYVSPRQKKLLGLMLASSIGVHLAALAIAPSPGRVMDRLRPMLEVVIVRPPAPEPMLQESPSIERKSTAARSRIARESDAKPKPKPAPPPPVPKQLLALPDPDSSPAPAFTVPQAVVEPPPPAADHKPAISAIAAPPAPREVLRATPAIFNAAYLRNAVPRYPLIARRNGVEGIVRLKVLVTRDGGAAEVHVDQTSGSSALDTAALEAVRDWRFVPARRGEEPTDSWVLVPIVFKLQSSD